MRASGKPCAIWRAAHNSLHAVPTTMSRRRLSWPAFLSVLVLPAAALEWKAETLTIATVPFQKTQDVIFAFKNSGPKPVTLLDLQTNCDCLDATADGKTYLPGAVGTIKARFTIGDRVGHYERVITLITDESPVAVRLMVRIEVPDVATVSPRSVGWKLNETAAEKTVELTPAPGLEIIFTEATATNDAFTARLETIEVGRHYRLHVKPGSTAKPASAPVRVQGREKSGHDVVLSAYASIQ